MPEMSAAGVGLRPSRFDLAAGSKEETTRFNQERVELRLRNRQLARAECSPASRAGFQSRLRRDPLRVKNMGSICGSHE